MGTLKVNSIEPINGELIIKGEVVIQPTPTPTSTPPQNLYNSSCCVLVSSYCGNEVSCGGQIENGRPTFQFTFGNGESGIIIWYPQFNLSPTGTAWVLWDFPQTTQLAYLPINSTSPIGNKKQWVWIYNSQSICLSNSAEFQTLPHNVPCITPTPTQTTNICSVLDIQTNCGPTQAYQTGVLNGRPTYSYTISGSYGGVIYWDPVITSWIVEETSNGPTFGSTNQSTLPPGPVLQLVETQTNPLPLPISTVINPWGFVNNVSSLYWYSCYGQGGVAGLFITSVSTSPCPTPTPTSSPISGNTLCGTGYVYIYQNFGFGPGQFNIVQVIEGGGEIVVPGPNGLESTDFKLYISTIDADGTNLKPYFQSLINSGNDVYFELCQDGDNAVYRITSDSFVIPIGADVMMTPRTTGTITQITYSSREFSLGLDKKIIIDLDPIIPVTKTPTPSITRTPIPSCVQGCYYYKLRNKTATPVTFSYVDCLGNSVTSQHTSYYGDIYVCATRRGIIFYTQPWQLSYPQPILTWEIVGCCPTPTPTATPTLTKTPTRTPQPTFCTGNCYNTLVTLNSGQTFAQITYIGCGANQPTIEYLYSSGMTATTFCTQDVVPSNTYSAVTFTNLGCCPTRTPTPTPTITRTPQPTFCTGNCYNSLVTLNPGQTFAQITYIGCGSIVATVEYLYISGVTATTFCSQDFIQGATTMSAITITNLGCCPTRTPTPTPTVTPTEGPCCEGWRIYNQTPARPFQYVDCDGNYVLTGISTFQIIYLCASVKPSVLPGDSGSMFSVITAAAAGNPIVCTGGTLCTTPTPTSTPAFTPTQTSSSGLTPCNCWYQTVVISQDDLNNAIGNDITDYNGKVFVDYVPCTGSTATTISYDTSGSYNSDLCATIKDILTINIYYYSNNIIIGKETVKSSIINTEVCCTGIVAPPPDPEA